MVAAGTGRVDAGDQGVGRCCEGLEHAFCHGGTANVSQADKQDCNGFRRFGVAHCDSCERIGEMSGFDGKYLQLGWW